MLGLNASEDRVKMPVLVNLHFFVFAEILLFERPPVDNYEYINPCKYARSEAAEGSDSDDDFDDDDNDNAYEEVSSSLSTDSPCSLERRAPTSSVQTKSMTGCRGWCRRWQSA